MSFNIFKSQHCRFLHYVAEVTGERKFRTFPFAKACFYKKYFTTNRSPCKTRYYTGIFIALVFVSQIWWFSQQGFYIFGLNQFISKIGLNFCHYPVRNLTKYLIYLQLQLTNTTLACVTFYKHFERLFAKADVIFFTYPGIFHLFWYKVTAGNFYFFFS